MTRTLLIFCLVTVLAHAVVTFLRWLLVKLERSSHEDITRECAVTY